MIAGEVRQMKILYVATAGAGDPTRASIPWHLAVNGSMEVGQETGVVLAGDATELIVGGTAESLEGLGVPPMKELLEKARVRELPVYV
jgi:predicted peroxiredoxin